MSEQIKEIYRDPPSRGSFMPILLILVVISLFSSLYANVQRKMLRQAGQESPCNPRYVFFSGLLNPFQKDPWGATEKNFKRCIRTNMYRDPALTKQIRNNRKNIHESEATIQTTFNDGYKNVQNTTEKEWKPVKNQSQKIGQEHTQEINKIFSSQNALHDQVKKKTVQLYYVLESILKYIHTSIVIRLGQEKMDMSIDENHARFMKKYKELYAEYTSAYMDYDNKSYKSASQKAVDLSKKYRAFKEEITEFRRDHRRNKIAISKGCRRLNRVYGDNTHSKCLRIFPYIAHDIAANSYITNPL
jgi:hypothetical protein